MADRRGNTGLPTTCSSQLSTRACPACSLPPSSASRPDDARKAAARPGAQKPVAVVGVGGGSAIDLPRLMGSPSRTTGDRGLFRHGGLRLARLPMAAVPTTGHGRRGDQIAMPAARVARSSSARRRHHNAVIRLAISLHSPCRATADALCHAVESLLSANRPSSSVALEASLRFVAGSLEQSTMSRFAGAARTHVRRALCRARPHAGVVLGHSIGYTPRPAHRLRMA